jgi:hypothetical protein
VVTSAELPWDFRIARIVKPRPHDVLVEVTRPAVAALEIDMPIDLGAKLHRAGAEHVEPMRKHLICFRSEPGRCGNERLRQLVPPGKVQRRYLEPRGARRLPDRALVVAPESMLITAGHRMVQCVVREQPRVWPDLPDLGPNTAQEIWTRRNTLTSARRLALKWLHAMRMLEADARPNAEPSTRRFAT